MSIVHQNRDVAAAVCVLPVAIGHRRCGRAKGGVGAEAGGGMRLGGGGLWRKDLDFSSGGEGGREVAAGGAAVEKRLVIFQAAVRVDADGPG